MKHANIVTTATDKLEEEIRASGKGEVAKSIGIHQTTLNHLLDDSWDRLDRHTLERVCDYLRCTVGDLLRLQPAPFWGPFTNTGEYKILRGILRKGTTKPPLEEHSKTLISHFFEKKLGCRGGFAEIEGDEAISEFARKNSCVVIGSHFANRAFEILMCEHFGAKPYSGNKANRDKLPFWMVRPEPKERTLVEKPRRGLGEASGLGIFSRERQRLLVEVTRWSESAFYEARTKEAHDAAIVLIKNIEVSPAKLVKLIILAGVSGVGTHGAALAILKDFRDLDPVPQRDKTTGKLIPNDTVVGILDILFKKSSSGDSREPFDHQWVYLKGGRRTVE